MVLIRHFRLLLSSPSLISRGGGSSCLGFNKTEGFIKRESRVKYASAPFEVRLQLLIMRSDTFKHRSLSGEDLTTTWGIKYQGNK